MWPLPWAGSTQYLNQMSQSPGIPNMLRPRLKLQLHKLLPRELLAGNQACYALPVPIFPRALVQALRTNHSCILHTNKISTIWRMTSFAAKSTCNLAPLTTPAGKAEHLYI